MAGMFDPANQARYREAIGAARRLVVGVEHLNTYSAAQTAAIVTAFNNSQGQACNAGQQPHPKP